MNFIPFLPPSWDRIQRSNDEVNIPVCIIVKCLKNISKSTSDEETQRYYLLRIHLYDATYKQFFGRVCQGGIRKEDIENDLINFNQEFYFHTFFCDENILLVFEVLEVNDNDEKSVAWTSLRLFKANDRGLGLNNGMHSLYMFNGSCYALIYMDTMPEFNPSSEKMEDSELEISLSFYKPLLKITHLIPDNYLISYKESIPGLNNTIDNSCTLKGMVKLKKIILKSCTYCTLFDLNLSIGSTIDEFESNLSRSILTESGENILEIEVGERRIQIGLHNGHEFIEEPHVYHLVSGSAKTGGGLTRTSSGKRNNWSFRSKQSRNFLLRNKVMLNNVPMESGICLVFIVEYILNLSTSRNLNVAVFGGRWQIFPECFKSPNGTKNIELNTQNDYTIDKSLKIIFYKSNQNEMPNIKFTYQIGKKIKSKMKRDVDLSYSDSIGSGTNTSENDKIVEISKENVGTEQELMDKIPKFVIPLVLQKQFGISRALNSYLASFTPILDRWNQPATLVDSRNDETVDFVTEEMDLLKSNEIIVQFLGFRRTNRSQQTRAITISFQLFKFDIYNTESLFLIPSTSPDQPNTLKSMENLKSSEIPQVRFTIDSSHYWHHNTMFIHYLVNYNLHFDIFDSESQFYLGQCSIPLKNLCRGGREGVQFTDELEIIFPNGVVESVENGNSCLISGYLYIRLANIGQMMAATANYKSPVTIVKSETRIYENNSDHVIKARSLRDLRNNEENLEEKLRKLKRMEIVRAAHPNENVIKLPKSRSLKNIELWREEKKHESITKILHENLTTIHTIDVDLGTLAFFEFSIENPFPHPVTAIVDIDDPDLKIVNSVDEWEFFKRLNRVAGNVEENFVSFNSSNLPQIFLHANERVNVPFKYQTFNWNFDHKSSKTNLVSTPLKTRKQIRVKFNSHTNSLICILIINVTVYHPSINTNLIFFQASDTTLYRCIAIPPLNFTSDDMATGNNNKQIYVICTQPATCDVVGNSTKRNLTLKVPVGSFGEPVTLFAFIYTNESKSTPSLVYRISVIPLTRIDVTCVLSQSRNCQLVIKGKTSNRKLHCYVTDDDVNVCGNEFLLANGETRQIDAKIDTKMVGFKNHFINLIDTNNNELIQSWILCVTTDPPIISKVFKIDIRLGKEENKKVYFTNRYQEARVFYLRVSHPELVKIKESVMKLAPDQKNAISLWFPSMPLPGPNEILLFIDNEIGKNEDIYKIQIIYDFNR